MAAENFLRGLSEREGNLTRLTGKVLGAFSSDEARWE